MTASKTTASLTDSQITALRTRAAADGDDALVNVCWLALGEGLPTATTPDQETAREQLAVVVAAEAPTVALVETMPEALRESHRAARNWGQYPINGAIREWMAIEDAEQAVADDEDGYARIVETMTREDVLDLLRRGDSGLYEPAADEGLVQLTEDAVALVRAADLTVDADAYGCAFCREQLIED